MHLKSLHLSLSQPVHSATDLNLDQSIQCPEQLLEAILHYIYHLYKSLEVIEPNQIIYLIQSILRTPTSFSRVNLVWLTLYYGCITALLSRSLKSQWFSGLHRVSNFTQVSVTIKAQATTTTTTSFICMTIQTHTVLQKLCLGIKITT